MNTSDFFNELGLGDPDMDKAREWVSYRKFANSVPDILTLDEYIDTIYKKVITDNAKPHMWFSQRYMVAKYLLESGSKNNATDDFNARRSARVAANRVGADKDTWVEALAVCENASKVGVWW